MKPWRMFVLFGWMGACCVGLSGPFAAEAPGEKLLLGFEEDEIKRIDGLLFGKESGRSEATGADGKTTVTLKMPFVGINPWLLAKGEASQGQFSVGIGGGQPQKIALAWYPPNLQVPPEPSLYFGLIHSGNHFNSCGTFRRLFPKDWSENELFRFDVFCGEQPHILRILLEDEEIAPPIMRTFAVPAGKWTTLEVDLKAAAKERGLDPKRMANLLIGVVKVEGALKKPGYSARLDNLRLCARDAKAGLPVVRDESPHTLPDYYQASSKPVPEKLPEGTPDRTPLSAETPFVIQTEKPAYLSPVGWAAAYDNRNMLVGFGQAAVDVLQSTDSGKTWRGLDGSEKPTRVHTTPYTDHQCGRGDAVGARSDVVLLASIGCNGTATAALRVFCQKLTFTGAGWKLREQPGLADCDPRHCISTHSAVRAPDGRLWAGYGLVGRLGTNQINVRYSDDDGIVWKGSRAGTSGVIPGTILSDEGGVGFGYTFDEPCLVPFGPAVACIWLERKGYSFGKLKWTRFDGKSWTPLEAIPEPKWTVYPSTGTRPPIHAVSLEGKEIFLASAYYNGVQHYRDGQWRREAEEIPPGARICLAGGKTVVVVAAVNDVKDPKRVNEFFGDAGSPKKGPVVLKVWQRKADGTWSSAREVAREQEPFWCAETQYVFRPGYAVPAVSPPNFVPVAWTTGQKWIKFLRVPVAE